jgi:hypothetical protein
VDSFKDDADNESNFLKLNFELESKTIIAKVITANGVKNEGENWIIGLPLYFNAPKIMPTNINSNRFGIFNFLEIIDDNNPIRRIIPIDEIYSRVSSIFTSFKDYLNYEVY